MRLTVIAAGSKKSALAVAVLLLTALVGDSVGAGRQSSAPQRKVARSPRMVSAIHHDLSPALRDLPRKPPSRDRVEREMHKPRPMRGQPSRIGREVADPVVQSAPAALNMPSSSRNFEGVSNVNGVLPPDTNGAVGPNHYVQWVNLSFAVYDKSGTLLYGPADGNTVWSGFGGVCELSNNGDPVVLHDDLADRWVMSQLAIPYFPFGPFYQCIAISQTADPTGAFYRYEFVISDTKLNDYPKLGVWPDAYYMGVNQFDALTSAWQGQGVVAFEREKMLAGLPARMVYFDLFSVDPNLGGMLPSHVDGAGPPPGSPNIFVQFDDDGLGYAPQDQMQLWSFHVDWTDPSASTFSGPTILPTASFDSNLCNYARNCIPQGGTIRKVDAISDRLMYRLQYRNFGTHQTLVVNHTVNVGGDHAGIRWYEIRDPLGTPVIHQQGTYAPDGDHRWMGSVAMDGAGNMALGFSASSAASFPSIRYTGRLADDPPGTLAQGESLLIAGSGSQTDSTGRWGDYSAMSVDPTDHCTFWYTQEYYATTSGSNWRTRVGSFAFPSCATNLPSVTIAATSQATEAGLTNGVFTVSRTGNTDADLILSYVITGSATAGSDYVALVQSVTIPAGSATATIDVTPLDDSLVEPEETVVVTLSPDPAYVVGTPSSAIVFIISDDLPPDLVVTSLSAPTASGAGTTITVTDTTKNQGGGPADATTTRIYLSSNTLLDAGDVPLGDRAVPALSTGASNFASTVVTIPAGTVSGSYYILAKADADNSAVETQENNNLRASFITIGPDLTVSTFTAPGTAGAGTTITVTDTTKNQGGGPADVTTTRFYLSTNTVLDASDVPMGDRAVPALAAGASQSASTMVTIPAGTASGSYYILAKADADNAAVETQENNNLRASFISIGPDLVISAFTAPSTAGAGSTITVTDTTKNQGGGAADLSTTRFYLSANTVLDTSDVPLGDRAVPVLAAGASHSASTAVTIPAGTASGSYYILAKADADNAVGETQEGNNLRSWFISIGPDLVISAFTAPSTAGAGSAITVTDTTKDQGGGAADASTTRFYLSANTLLDTGDVPLGDRAVPALAAGTSHSASTAVTIPAGTASGSYYILAKADADNAVAETQEGNNLRSWFISIGPDLTVSTLTAPNTAGAGSVITVTDATKNQGGGAAGATTTRLYLSTNTLLDAGDVPMGDRAVPALAAGTSHSASTAVTIPAGTATGSYYILAKADADNAVVENQEGNNLKSFFISIGPDLVILTLTAPGTAGAGSTITVTDATKNQGGGPANATTTRFYLSTNTVLDAGDVPLGDRAVPALAAGTSHSASTAVTIPAGTASGSYFILAKGDADNAVVETQEGNNVKSFFITIGPDLAVSTLTAPSTGVAGTNITVTDTTKNQGGGAADASTTRFYLSTNTVLDAGDVPLGDRAVPALAAGASHSASTMVTIPAGTASGGYYILAKADADNAVGETQEGNNLKASFISITANSADAGLLGPGRPSGVWNKAEWSWLGGPDSLKANLLSQDTKPTPRERHS